MEKSVVLLVTAFVCIMSMAAYNYVRAQGAAGALVVATCGTLGQAYAVGATRRLTVNTNGQVCQ